MDKEMENMNEVEFQCKECGLHYSVMCEDIATVIELTTQKGCPECGTNIRAKRVNGKYFMTVADIEALYHAELVKVVVF